MSTALTILIRIVIAIVEAIVAAHPELKTNATAQSMLRDVAELHASAKAG